MGDTLAPSQEGAYLGRSVTSWTSGSGLDTPRLDARYRTLLDRGKCPPQVVIAVGRELLGFIWAIGVTVETEQRNPRSVAA